MQDTRVRLLALLLVTGCTTHRAPPYVSDPAEQIWFSGHLWVARTGDVVQGAGPNYWGGVGSHVHSHHDAMRLELKPDGQGLWRAAEVSTPIAPGTRRIRVTFSLDEAYLDPEVVLGVFIYRDDQSEFDFELSTWGKQHNAPLQFVVVPAYEPDHMHRFEPLDDKLAGTWTQIFEWGPRTLRFTLYHGTREVNSWLYKGVDVPRYDGHRLHINLWLLHGQAPRSQRHLHVDILDVKMQ